MNLRNGIPTESRIFADRYLRETRHFEALHAANISPGTNTWVGAVKALFARMQQKGPSKRAVIIRQAADYLDHAEGLRHFMLMPSAAASRSASLWFAAFKAGHHPLVGVEEEGVSIVQHLILCTRNGAKLLGNIELAHVSWHAIARLHQRGDGLTMDQASGVLKFIAALGHLTRYNKKHITGGLHMHFGHTLIAGALRHPNALCGDRNINGTFYDVRTALANDGTISKEQLEQGHIATQVVAAWFVNGRAQAPSEDKALADAIPFLPRRTNDNVFRSLGTDEWGNPT